MSSRIFSLIPPLGHRLTAIGYRIDRALGDQDFSTEQRWRSVLILLALGLSLYLFALYRESVYDDDLPLFNRRFALEPRVFARIRWATRSMEILDDAQQKVCLQHMNHRCSCWLNFASYSILVVLFALLAAIPT